MASSHGHTFDSDTSLRSQRSKSEGCPAGAAEWRVGGPTRRFETTAWQASLEKAICPPMFHYVYLLTSELDPDRHYVGLTGNLEMRLAAHNSGKVTHTSKHLPWRFETTIAFRDRPKAAAFEKYLKSGSGREFARRHF